MKFYKKYCHLVFDEYPKDPRVRRYSNVLKENGYFVIVICITNGKSPLLEKSYNEIIIRIPIKKTRGGGLRRIFEYTVFQLYATIISSLIYLFFRVRNFHVHTLPDFLVFSCIIPRLFGERVILDFHELFPEFMMQYKSYSDYNHLLIKVILFIEKISYHFANIIIVFHEPAKLILQKRIKSQKYPTVIMNGVDENEIISFTHKQSDNFKIIYNGTINFNLNLIIVLKALEIIKKKYPEDSLKISFHLFGDGPDLPNIIREAEKLKLNSVIYEGIFPFNELTQKLMDASACIIPPKKDVYSDLFYSIKMLEMIYLKIPVIASRLRTYELYYPNDCILYFTPNDENDLAKKIMMLYNKTIDVSAMTNRAFNQYQNYKWELMKERFIKLLN